LSGLFINRFSFRKHTAVEDPFGNLLISSDPFIPRLSKINDKKNRPRYAPEAKSLTFNDTTEDIDDHLDEGNSDEELPE